MLITLAEKPHILIGMAYGFRQPSLYWSSQVQLPSGLDASATVQAISANLMHAVGVSETRASPSVAGLLQSVADASLLLLQQSGHPLFDRARVVPRAAEHIFVLSYQERSAAAIEKALRAVVERADRLMQDSLVQQGPSLNADAVVWAESLIRELGETALPDFNTLHFLRAAHSKDIPWRNLGAQVYQLGQGARARLLNSSFTDATPVIGMGLARDKKAAATVLHNAGIPVPEHHAADGEDAAVQIAVSLGYPVVVKPADKDGGLGVSSGLQAEDEVRRAYATARKHSKSIIVEKHVVGRDYRLVILNGRCVYAYERQPAAVVGDGVQTVAALLVRFNADPRRGDQNRHVLRRVPLDEETRSHLLAQDLRPDSVVAAGRSVYLRRVASRLQGGTPVVVTEQVHPDNRRLAERAVSLLRLDLAGVDLLIPDIRRSWLQTGAAICEVNAQPTISNAGSVRIHADILQSLVSGTGRIPIALIVGGSQVDMLSQRLEVQLAACGLRVGLSSSQRLSIAGVPIAAQSRGGFQDAYALIVDPAVDAAIVGLEDPGVLQSGLPFDRCDVIVIAGAYLGTDDAQGRRALKVLLSMVSVRRQTALVVDARDLEGLALSAAIQADRIHQAQSEQELLDLAIASLLPA